ncbi:hypothetical protein Bbelb_047130 [Branchiostoma belcheri]|nr:hypothetical protein Bbelb_047130 [Branchiostoma belcheri]
MSLWCLEASLCVCRANRRRGSELLPLVQANGSVLNFSPSKMSPRFPRRFEMHFREAETGADISLYSSGRCSERLDDREGSIPGPGSHPCSQGRQLPRCQRKVAKQSRVTWSNRTRYFADLHFAHPAQQRPLATRNQTAAGRFGPCSSDF